MFLPFDIKNFGLSGKHDTTHAAKTEGNALTNKNICQDLKAEKETIRHIFDLLYIIALILIQHLTKYSPNFRENKPS